jgi:hypothetical protein
MTAMAKTKGKNAIAQAMVAMRNKKLSPARRAEGGANTVGKEGGEKGRVTERWTKN